MLLTPSISGLHGETFTTYPLMQTSWPTDPDFKSLNEQSSLKFWNLGHMQNGSDKLLENSLVFSILIAQPRHPMTSLGLVLKVSMKSGNGSCWLILDTSKYSDFSWVASNLLRKPLPSFLKKSQNIAIAAILLSCNINLSFGKNFGQTKSASIWPSCFSIRLRSSVGSQTSACNSELPEEQFSWNCLVRLDSTWLFHAVYNYQTLTNHNQHVNGFYECRWSATYRDVHRIANVNEKWEDWWSIWYVIQTANFQVLWWGGCFHEVSQSPYRITRK